MLLKENTLSELKKTKIVFIIIVITAIIIYLYNIFYTKSLFNNFIIYPGKIIALTNLSKSSPRAEFIYSINGKIYSGSEPHPNFRNFNDRYILIGKFFPVIVDSTDYKNKKMLFDSLSFVQYGITYPDSLRWLNKYLK